MSRAIQPFRASPTSVLHKKPKRSVQWFEIERTILLRIANKEYTPGRQLPTCEALAAELGANKNTVSKAYRLLAQRGYLLTRAGRGTFVSKRSVRPEVERSLDGIRDLLSLAVQEAKLSGVRPTQFQQLVEEVVSRSYQPSGPRVGFIECNAHDTTTLSRDLQRATAHRIEPLLLDDVLADPGRFLGEFEILAVNLTHLAELEAAIGSRLDQAAGARILGMHIPIDLDSLLQVTRLRAGTNVGVVCDLRRTLLSLTGLIRGCNPAVQVEGCLTEEAGALRDLLAWSDVLLVTPSAMRGLRLNEAHVPIITLAFRPDDRSVEQLSALIAQRPH